MPIGTQNTRAIFVACLLLMGLVLVAAVGVMWFRRWLKRSDDMPAGGFSLSQLREMVKSGKISIEEFEKTKAMVIGAAHKSTERPKANPNNPNNSPPPAKGQ